MDARVGPIVSVAWRGVVVLLTLEVATVSALRYLTHSQPAPDVVLANGHAHPFLVVHVVSGIIALVLGPLQFARTLRARFPALHRASGRVFIAACAISAPSALMLAMGTTAGPIAGVGFAIPALLLPVFAWMGLRAAIEGRFDHHREWMLRAYALVSTAITLRLMLPAAGLLGVPFLAAYLVIAWASWSTNLALFEWRIRRRGAGTLVASQAPELA